MQTFGGSMMWPGYLVDHGIYLSAHTLEKLGKYITLPLLICLPTGLTMVSTSGTHLCSNICIISHKSAFLCRQYPTMHSSSKCQTILSHHYFIGA